MSSVFHLFCQQARSEGAEGSDATDAPIELTEEEKNLWARTTDVTDLSQAHGVPCHRRVHISVLSHIRRRSAFKNSGGWSQVVFLLAAGA